MMRIAVDRIKLYNINLYSIDFNKLLSNKNKANVKVEFDNNDSRYSSIISLESLKYLRIIDNNKFVEFTYYSTNRYHFNRCNENESVHLTISVSNAKDNNIENLTIKEYREFIYSDVVNYLENKYGLKIDVARAKVSNIEINTTFIIEHQFKEYKRVIDVFFSTLPKTLRKVHECSIINDDNEKEYETSCAKSSNFKLIIYDKKKQHNQKRKYQDDDSQLINADLMRIEFSLLNSKKVVEALSTNELSILNDSSIVAYYSKQFEKLIVKRYNKWRKENNTQLEALIDKYKSSYKITWQNVFLHHCRNHEQSSKGVLLLDINDIVPALNKYNKSARIMNGFYNKKVEDDVFFNDDSKKATEILNKVNKAIANSVYGNQ